MQWVPLFNRPELVHIVLDSLQFLNESHRLTLFGYVVLENHLHFIASSRNLSKEIANFKSFTARKILQHLKDIQDRALLERLSFFKLRHKFDRTFQVWQEGSHPEAILNRKILIQKLNYIHQNPVERGYVEKAEDWRYSSAQNYVGKEGLIPVCKKWI